METTMFDLSIIITDFLIFFIIKEVTYYDDVIKYFLKWLLYETEYSYIILTKIGIVLV